MAYPSHVTALKPVPAVDDDRALLVRMRLGDEAAFRAIFVAYTPELVTFATRLLGAEAAAEDVVHDVMLGVWQTRASWEVRDSVRAYLFGAVRNRAIRYLKHERVVWRWEQRVANEASLLPMWGGSVSPSDDDTETRDAALARAVGELPDRCHRVFTLRWQRGLSYAEIAEVMGISLRTVENQLARALKILRGKLVSGDASEAV